MIMPVMAAPWMRMRRGTVLEVVAERPGAVELMVEVEGDTARAVSYPPLVGPVRPGDRVLLNTTAVWLRLGTGGDHFVIAVEGSQESERPGSGRTMKLRYSPHQVTVLSAEEEGSPHRVTMEAAAGLHELPVVWVPLHSMVGPAVAGARAGGADRVAYVMTDGAALPAGISRVAAALRETGLLSSVISSGQAFGGDLEAVSVFSALLAGRHVTGADVLVVGDGPGNVGTGTAWGASDVESAMSLNAAGILGGRPVAALRISFADPRERHRGVSHHSITALSKVALVPVHVAVPALDDEGRRRLIWDSLRDAGLQERHQLVETTGRPALDLLAEHGIEPESMGRKVAHDPEFFLAAGAAGVLAGRMAAKDRAWRGRSGGCSG
jgi:uncharacterized protein DUF3866